MSSKFGFEGNSRSMLAYSILVISVVAALSSVGIAYAATSTTTSASTGSQSSSGSQSSAASSSHDCPNTGNYAGGNSTSVGGTAW